MPNDPILAPGPVSEPTPATTPLPPNEADSTLAVIVILLLLLVLAVPSIIFSLSLGCAVFDPNMYSENPDAQCWLPGLWAERLIILNKTITPVVIGDLGQINIQGDLVKDGLMVGVAGLLVGTLPRNPSIRLTLLVISTAFLLYCISVFAQVSLGEASQPPTPVALQFVQDSENATEESNLTYANAVRQSLIDLLAQVRTFFLLVGGGMLGLALKTK